MKAKVFVFTSITTDRIYNSIHKSKVQIFPFVFKKFLFTSTRYFSLLNIFLITDINLYPLFQTNSMVSNCRSWYCAGSHSHHIGILWF